MSSALLGAILSSVITSAGNIALSERQRKKNEENQDKQNTYNAPREQIQRLLDAGVNPNSLTMDNGMTVSGNTSANVNPYTTPSLADPMSMASNSFLALAQGKTEESMRAIRLQEAEENANFLRESARKLGLEADYQGILNGYAAAQQEAALRESAGRTAEHYSNVRVNLYQVKVLKETARELQYRIDNILPQELKNKIAEEKLTLQQLPEILARIANYEANTELTQEQRNTEELNQALVQEDIALRQEEAIGKGIENKNAQKIADLVMKEYQASINKLTQEGKLTEQEAYYYLFDLSKRNAVRFFGIPLFGAGGYEDMRSTHSLQKQVRNTYPQYPNL